VKFTQYFLFMRQRPDWASIKLEWTQCVIDHRERENVCGITVEHARDRADIPQFSYEQITA
jgi:uncharacterized protein YuzE